MNTIIWLIIVAVMLVIEVFTMGLTTIWFSIGAVAAAITSAVDGPLWLQITLFCVVSIVVMLLVRPFAMKVVNQEKAKTNVDEIIGKKGIVQETIDNQKGQGKVLISGMEWTARSAEEEIIPADTSVEVTEISGVKVIVKKV